MPEWTVSIETAPNSAFDVGFLERAADALERDFGHLAPAAAVHGHRLAVIFSVDEESAELALTAAIRGLRPVAELLPPSAIPAFKIAHVEVDAVEAEQAVA